MGVNIHSRMEIMGWGDKEFNGPIKNCIQKLLICMTISLQSLIHAFVTDIGTGDNRFIFQPLLKNNNLKHPRKNKRIVFQKEFFELPNKVRITVNQLYNLNKFIPVDDFNRLTCQAWSQLS